MRLFHFAFFLFPPTIYRDACIVILSPIGPRIFQNGPPQIMEDSFQNPTVLTAAAKSNNYMVLFFGELSDKYKVLVINSE